MYKRQELGTEFKNTSPKEMEENLEKLKNDIENHVKRKEQLEKEVNTGKEEKSNLEKKISNFVVEIENLKDVYKRQVLSRYIRRRRV